MWPALVFCEPLLRKDEMVYMLADDVKEGTMVDPDEVVEASKEDILCQKTSLGSFAQEAKVSS